MPLFLRVNAWLAALGFAASFITHACYLLGVDFPHVIAFSLFAGGILVWLTAQTQAWMASSGPDGWQATLGPDWGRFLVGGSILYFITYGSFDVWHFGSEYQARYHVSSRLAPVAAMMWYAVAWQIALAAEERAALAGAQEGGSLPEVPPTRRESESHRDNES